jgi:hypothetical protein
MSDAPKPPAPETAMQRALRLKKAALAARPQTPSEKRGPRAAAGPPVGASKPWMSR